MGAGEDGAAVCRCCVAVAAAAAAGRCYAHKGSHTVVPPNPKITPQTLQPYFIFNNLRREDASAIEPGAIVFSTKSDVVALGVIALQLATGRSDAVVDAGGGRREHLYHWLVSRLTGPLKAFDNRQSLARVANNVAKNMDLFDACWDAGVCAVLVGIAFKALDRFTAEEMTAKSMVEQLASLERSIMQEQAQPAPQAHGLCSALCAGARLRADEIYA